MYKDVNEFQNKIIKLKNFKELPEQYKSIKFIKLYFKMYNYMLSIPKEKIVLKTIIERNTYLSHLFKNILYYFIEAKDFYHWKDRIYSLLTEKISSTNYKKYELLYGSKAKEFFNQYLEKQKATWMKNLGVEHPSQSKEIQDKMKKTCIEIYGVEHPSQSKEVQDKMKATCLEKYNKEHAGGWFDVTSHSKFGNEVCTAIDNLLGNPEDSIYYAKSGKEYCIHTNTKNYYVDMVIPSLGLAFEADGVYYHGLIEGQEYVYNTPVKEIWEKDKEKSEVIEKAGYKVFHIRDDEYYKDPETCINNLLEQIREYFQ